MNELPYMNMMPEMLLQPEPSNYDFVMAGGGMAALSLAYYLSSSTLCDKSILIIDKDTKNKNDHTYCFWESDESTFEAIVSQKWGNVWFYGIGNFSQLLNLDNLKYKMIKGIDFYNFVLEVLAKNKNVNFIQANILEISDSGNSLVKTSKGDFSANKYIFDSISLPKYNDLKYNNLLQHFYGYVIETAKPFFNLNEPTLFDFRVDQKNELRFVYVLPISETKALVEFTIFSDNLLEKKVYESELEQYIRNLLKINDNEYNIIETEFGIVPMSDEPHQNYPSPKIIRIGTAGGYVKASTGYSFQRTQVYLKKLVQSIEHGTPLPKSINKRWKGFLDSVLLNLMLKKRANQALIFTILFSKNKPSNVLRFLSEETSIFEDIKLMNTVPKLPFIKSAINEIVKRII